MTRAKSKFAATTVTLLALAAIILWQEQRANRLMTELAALREDVARSKLVGESALIKPQASTEQPMTEVQVRELLRLRGQVATLRVELADMTNTALKAAQAARDKVAAANEASERYKQEIVPRTLFARDWMNAFQQYATENQGRFPTNFNQATRFLSDEAKVQTNVTTDEFEIIYQGSRNDLTNRGDDNVIVLRERQVRHRYDGKWGRVYGLADGSSLQRFLESENALEQWEGDHRRTTATR